MNTSRTGTEDAGRALAEASSGGWSEASPDAAGHPDPSPEQDAASERRRSRWTGALPIALLLVVVAGVALLVSPWLREQARTSFVRQPEPYLALFFDDEQQARQCPLDEAGRLVLQVGLTSQLSGDRTISWTAQVVPSAGTTASATTEGTVHTTPGRTSDFTVRLDAPRGSYAFALSLPGRSERLQLRCEAT